MKNPITELRELRVTAREAVARANSYEDSVLVWVVGMAAAAIALLVNRGIDSLGPLSRFGFALFPIAISAGLLSRLATRFLLRREAPRLVRKESEFAALEGRAEMAMGTDPREVVRVIKEAQRIDPGRSRLVAFLGIAGDVFFMLCVSSFLAGLWILVCDLLRRTPSG